MPTIQTYHYSDLNPHRWLRCRQIAGAAMIKEGWNPHAKKFLDVQRKRATRLWNA